MTRDPSDPSTWAINPYAVTCPQCAAEPGNPCRGRMPTHTRRMTLARKTLETR